MSHFSMGAINKITNKYECPKFADRENKYKCPSCEKDVIFRKGPIKKPHFAHYKSENPCMYYEKPNETQIHKDAKLLMKLLLDDNKNIFIKRECDYCDLNGRPFNYSDEYEILSDDYTENTKAFIEYKFEYNNSIKRADVALIENNKIKYIFEICHKNKTKEQNRPEPWFEIKAEKLINEINSGKIIDDEGNIFLECIRDYKCESCKNRDEYNKKRYEEFVENLKIKEKEQKLEKNELFLMSKEDIRTLDIQMKKEQDKIKRELEYKDRENQRKKIENEKRLLIEYERKIKMEKEKKEMEEKQRKLDEYNREMLEFNKVCSICNINYCKCLKPNFVKNEHNIIKCVCCDKRQCKCVRITDFFKK